MKNAVTLLPLLAGLALGSGTVWIVQHLRARASAPPADASPSAPSATTASAARSGSTPPAPGPQLLLPPPLAGVEADAALEAYLALPPLPKDAPADEAQLRRDRLDALLTLLPDSHFPRLLDVLATREGNAEGRLRRAALDVWTEHDAPAAARWAFALAPGAALNANTRTSYVTAAALAWSRDDFTAAYAWAGSLAEKPLRDSLLPRLLGQLAATDPRQAAALAANGDESFVRAAQRSVFEAWANRDPVAALQHLGPALLEQRDHPWSMTQALIKWVARDPSAALDWAAAHPSPDSESHRDPLNNISWSLVTQNPEAVRPLLEALIRREDLPDRARAVRDIFGPWAGKYPSAALAWLETVPDGAQRSDLIGRALNHVETGRADDFIALARRLPESSERDETITGYFSNWAQKDPDAALAWLAKHHEPELARAAGKIEGTLIVSLAATDPAAALARWQAIPADDKRLEFAAPLASAWAKSDPVAATRWFAAQLASATPNDPRAQDSLWKLNQVATGWLARDPVGYVEWAKALPPGTARDHALDALNQTSLYSRYGDSPAEAPPRAAFAEKLALIPDEALRERALLTHLSNWLRADLRSARAWIDSSEALTPEAAARLLNQIGGSAY